MVRHMVPQQRNGSQPKSHRAPLGHVAGKPLGQQAHFFPGSLPRASPMARGRCVVVLLECS